MHSPTYIEILVVSHRSKLVPPWCSQVSSHQHLTKTHNLTMAAHQHSESLWKPLIVEIA